MKRQSVEDYVKERFEMFNYYKENERINKPKDEYVKERFEMNSPVDEYVLVTNKEIARKNDIDLNKYYKVVEKKDDGGISIYNPRTGYLVRLSRDDFAYGYIHIVDDWLAHKNGLRTDVFYEVTEIFRNYKGEEIAVAITRDDSSSCSQIIISRGGYTFVKPVDKEEKPKNEPDLVNHPSHYETGKFECIEVMEEALGRDVVKGFCIGNAFKYLYRAKRKNGLEDLKKAQWYLNRVISMEDEDNTTDPYAEQKEGLIKLEEKILNEADKSERFV